MKATKEQIIETALQILERYEPLNRNSIEAKEEKISIYTESKEYYYKLNLELSFDLLSIPKKRQPVNIDKLLKLK